MMAPIFYFGCYIEKGHYFWEPFNKTKVVHWPKYQPWGVILDGGLLTKGDYFFEQRDGWTCLSFWDQSVDTRPGSNGAFLCNEIVTPAELVRRAQKGWPEVFARSGFPNLVAVVERDDYWRNKKG